MKIVNLFILIWVSFCVLPESNCQTTTFSLGQTIATAGGVPVRNSSFSLGFVQSKESISYSLGTWYVTDPSPFFLWSTNTSSSRGSELRLEQNGNLVVTGTDWSSKTEGSNVTSARFLSSGNFILQNGNGTTVWSTFDNPTDTLVPGQALVRGKSLVSGSYSLQVNSIGNMTLSWRNSSTSVEYWGSDTRTGPLTAAILDTNGVLKVHQNSSTSEYVKQFFALDYGPDVVRRLTLETDGNLRLYSLDSVWSSKWQAVSDQCKIFWTCGNYGICTYRAVSRGGGTRCYCPTGLSFLDSTRGCTNTGNISQCSTTNNRLVQSNNTAWLDNNATVTSQSSIEQCKGGCQNDAGCFGLLIPNDGSGNCVQIRTSVLSAYSTQSIQAISFLKVCNSAANSPPEVESEPSKSSTGAAVATAVGVTVLVVVLVEALLGWLLYRRRRRRRAATSARDAMRAYASGAPIRFTYKELQNATSNFSTKIGEGGFGAVYKGFLIIVPGSKTEVAIKKLEGVFQGEKEFRTEVATIGSTHHMNLMRLIGFCSEGADTRLLVYEYMPNGSLDRFLFHHEHDFVSITMQSQEFPLATSDDAYSQGSFVGRDVEAEEISREEGLDWTTRFKIAVGTAKALAYLHEECRETIIHCDLKPENILLDNSFLPKVSDFGLAKMLNDTNTRSLTAFRGTRGYLAPEWLANMPISSKSDVYSFGMVLLELVGGRRNYDTCPRVPRERHRFPQWVFQLLETDSLIRACDERMESSSVDTAQLERVVKVAFWCIQHGATSRPSMSKVVQMLEGNTPVLFPPLPKSLGESSSSATASATSSSMVSSTASSSVYSGLK